MSINLILWILKLELNKYFSFMGSKYKFDPMDFETKEKEKVEQIKINV
mgnify:CR=1 FL=1